MPDPPGGVHLHQLAVQQLGSEVPPEGQHLFLHAHRANARIALRASRRRTGKPPGVPTPGPNVGVMPSRGRIKILAPSRSCDELEMLVESGAEELYCGIVPREWMERYTGAMWLNRRSPNGSSLETWSDLKRLATDAHRAGLPLFVTMNGPYYTADQIPLVLDLARRLSEEIGVDALIVTDINLLLRLSEEKLAAQLHVSSVAATLNSEAIRFLASFGPRRVILPRSLTLAEIETIVREVGSGMEIEVFMLNDGCAFEEGFCATTHHHSVGAFCTSLSEMQATFEWEGPVFTPRRRNWLMRNLTDYREWVWY